MWVEKPIPAYQGDGPYVFVCYAHDDAEAVYAEIGWLNESGVNVWYDQGVRPGHEWSEELATAIEGCARVIYFVTPNSVASEHCRRELSFAQDEGREIVSVHLVPTELPAGLRLSLSNRQAIFKRELSEEDFYDRLMRATQSGTSRSASTTARVLDNRSPTIETTTGSARESSTSQPSIAVLPFDLIGGGEAENTISRGLTQDIISKIGFCRSLFVIARGTSFQFLGGQHDPGEVGAKLGVRYVCQGAVQIVGNQFRVSAGLADTHDRNEIWTRQYDGQLIDILAVQGEIAESIVSSLDYVVQRNEMRRASTLSPTNLDSWSAFHRGLDHMYKFRISECDEAETFFRRAIELEPGLARPYAGLSFVNYERAYLNLRGEREQALRLAFDQARRAVDADPRDPMGHWVLSRAYSLERDLESARKSIEIATDLNPSYANAHYFAAWISMQLGEHSTCRDRVELARRLSPQDPLIYGMNGVAAMSLALTGYKAEALDRIRESLVHPGMHYQARAMCVAVFSVAEEPELAAEQLRQVRTVNPNYGVQDFFDVYAFQHAPDIDKIKAGFRAAERLIG